jgi:peptidoglycan endopeptidase LytE
MLFPAGDEGRRYEDEERRDFMMGRWTFLGVGLVVLSMSFGFIQRGFAEERYTVKPGDNLYGISRSFNVGVDELKRANGLEGNAIRPGQILLIRTGQKKQTVETSKKGFGKTVERPLTQKESYVVRKGDNLYSISKRIGVPADEIKRMNQLHSAALKAGQSLMLPKLKSGSDEGAEEFGNAEEVTGEGSVDGDGDGKGAPEALGKWNNPEERALFVKVVKTFLGAPYRLGGSTLKGIDCSAFVKKIYQIFSVDLPRTAREQFCIGKKVEKDQLEEGDLVFFRTHRANNTHVGIYIGNNEFVHASSRNKEVKVDNLSAPYFSQRFLKGVRVKELETELKL